MSDEMNVTRNSKGNARLIFGTLLIVLGGLFLLNTIDIIDFNFGKVFHPGFIIAMIGVLLLIKSNKKMAGIVLLCVGLFLFLDEIFPWLHYEKDLIWPLLLILLGAFILLRKRIDGNKPQTGFGKQRIINEDMIDDVAVFGGGNKSIVSNNFKGGNITAVFGGSEIDLHQCKLSEGDNVIDVVAVFGGTTIIVPQDWNIVIDVFPLFGGFSNKILRQPNVVIDTDRKLIIKGVVIFGGGEVKTKF
ncbi:MAG: hypothetical protein Kow0098_19720 [Ignavibacteriaceae bacterium]